MSETFLNKAQLTGLTKDARRTEILRAKVVNALDASLTALDARVETIENNTDFGEWTSWTPTVTQSGSVTVTNTRSTYARFGRLIMFTLEVTVTGTGTGSNGIVVSLPVPAASTNAVSGITGYVRDVSSGQNYPFVGYQSSTTAFRLKDTTAAGSLGLLGGTTFTDALEASDKIFAGGFYEAAS